MSSDFDDDPTLGIPYEHYCPECGYAVPVCPIHVGESGATSGTAIPCPDCSDYQSEVLVWMKRRKVAALGAQHVADGMCRPKYTQPPEASIVTTPADRIGMKRHRKLHRKMRRRKWKVQPFYRWYDLWVGAYVDTTKKDLYLCVLGLGLKISYGKPERKTPVVDVPSVTNTCERIRAAVRDHDISEVE